MKTCSKCKILKKKEEFHKRTGRKCGVVSSCKTCIKERNKRNQAKTKLKKAEYYIKNKERINNRNKVYHHLHKDEVHARNKRNRLKNKERIKARRKYRAVNDINYRLRIRLRSRLYAAVRFGYKSGSAVADLGCLIEDLMVHLERQFTEGMTWENYGTFGWHIDHIKPLALFDLEDRNQFLEACHYTNLQPLWAKENLSKGIKF